MADQNQSDATKFFRGIGFDSYKIVDLHFVDNQNRVAKTGKTRYPSEPGRFDMVFTGTDLTGFFTGGWVEVKMGTATAFPFSSVRQEQIDWYHNVAVPKRISAWLFATIGEYAREDWRDTWEEILKERASRKIKKKRQLPKLTALMPFSEYLNETTLRDRKSFPYKDFATLPYLLDWKNGGWALPHNHVFYQLHLEGPPQWKTS